MRDTAPCPVKKPVIVPAAGTVVQGVVPPPVRPPAGFPAPRGPAGPSGGGLSFAPRDYQAAWIEDWPAGRCGDRERGSAGFLSRPVIRGSAPARPRALPRVGQSSALESAPAGPRPSPARTRAAGPVFLALSTVPGSLAWRGWVGCIDHSRASAGTRGDLVYHATSLECGPVPRMAGTVEGKRPEGGGRRCWSSSVPAGPAPASRDRCRPPDLCLVGVSLSSSAGRRTRAEFARNSAVRLFLGLFPPLTGERIYEL